MKILYTGVHTPDAIQTDPLHSLGGFVSSNQIPNGSINNIFPPISRNHIKRNIFDVRLIAFKNDSEAALSNLKIYSERGNYSSYKLAVVLPAINVKYNAPEFEKIESGNSLPYQATLDVAEGSDNAITVATLAAGACVGIWIERIVDLTKFTELDGKPSTTSLTNAELIAALQAQQAGVVQDEGSIKIEW